MLLDFDDAVRERRVSERWHPGPSAGPESFTGLDLGQSVDPSALVVAMRNERTAAPPLFDVPYMRRWSLGTSYPQIVADVAAMLADPQLGQQPTLAIDFTGVGRPVADLFRLANLPGELLLIGIHGGEAVTFEQGAWHVPKRTLIAVAQVALQTGRLRIAGKLPETETLRGELRDYRVKISAAGHDSYSAREGQHDDLVLALCLAIWAGERGKAGVWFA